MGDGRGEGGLRWDRFWETQQGSFSGLGSEHSGSHWADMVWEFYLASWRDIFARHAPGRSLLECGCGSARLSQFMAQQGYQCTLLDLSESGLRFAHRAFEAQSLSGRFLVADITALPFPPNEFDIVYAGSVLEFLPDIEVAIKETIRVLKPGGLLALTVLPNKFSCQTLADVQRTAASAVKRILSPRDEPPLRWMHHIPPGVTNAARLPDYVRLYQAAGLGWVSATVTSPFPHMRLGKAGDRLYAGLMRRLVPQWRRFDESTARWKDFWGATYTIFGTKF